MDCNFFNICFLLSVLLFLAFETNFIFEYANKLRIPLYDIKSYKNIINSGGKVFYLEYIKKAYINNFYIQLISCPICAGVWIAVVLSIFTNILFLPSIYLFGISGFYILKILNKYSI